MAKGTSAAAILRRIDKRMAALTKAGKKISDRSLSLEATGSTDTLRSIRRGVKDGKRRGISTDTVAKFAGPLHTSSDWLFSETGPESVEGGHIDSAEILQDKEPARKVPIKGYVGAGSLAHYYAISQEDFEEVPAPAGSSDRTVAVQIRGKSLGPLMDTWLVFYEDVRSPVTDDLYGKLCVVGLSDDRILIKQIKRERDGSITLVSNLPSEPEIKDADIEWAAEVTSMRPRLT